MASKTTAWVFGVIFILAAVLGFVGTSLVGTTGYFAANAALNVVNLIMGLALIIAAMTAEVPSIGTTLRTIGAIAVVLGLLGLIVGSSGMILGFLLANMADVALYLIAGIVMLLVPGIAHETRSEFREHEHRTA